MVSRACRELRESAERAIKLGKRTQQVDGWDFVIVIEGVRLVKNRVRPLKKRLKRIGNETIEKIRDVRVIHFVPGIQIRYKLIANRGRQKVAICRAGERTVRQMGAAARRIVDPDYELSAEQMLHAQVPLINLRIADRSPIQTIVVWETPKRQRSILISLRLRQS